MYGKESMFKPDEMRYSRRTHEVVYEEVACDDDNQTSQNNYVNVKRPSHDQTEPDFAKGTLYVNS